MFPRRSPRLADMAPKAVPAKVAKSVRAKTHKSPSMQISELPVAINPGCMLSNSATDGCCYQQDLRPKVASRSKRLRDPVENLPIVVESKEYADGYGCKNRRMVCYTRYCPTCQEYWSTRVNGLKDSVAFYNEILVNVDGLPMYRPQVRFERIQTGESMSEAITRIYTNYPGAQLMLDGAKKDAQDYSWNRV